MGIRRPRLPGGDLTPQHPALDRQGSVRRDDVDVVGLRRGLVARPARRAMRVVLPSSSGMRVTWRGSRCWTSTNAIPLSAGMCEKNFWKASRPPADAPIPTTGAGGEGRTAAPARSASGEGAVRRFVRFLR